MSNNNFTTRNRNSSASNSNISCGQHLIDGEFLNKSQLKSAIVSQDIQIEHENKFNVDFN